jgi:hypothetical protein
MLTAMQAQGAGSQQQPAVGDKKAENTKETSSFDAELTQAGLLAQQQSQQPQPVVPQAKAQGDFKLGVAVAAKEGQGKTGEVTQNSIAGAKEGVSSQQAGQALMQAAPLNVNLNKTADSSNTGSAMTGLKQAQDAQSKISASDTTAITVAALDSRLQSQQAALAPQKGDSATRGDADAALTSKLDLLSSDQALQAAMQGAWKEVVRKSENTQSQESVEKMDGAEAHSMQDMQHALLMMSGMDAATAGKALEAQAASMGGVVQN